MIMFSKVVYSVALLLPMLTAGLASVYERPLAFVYARSNFRAQPQYNDTQLLARFDLVKNNITAMLPFFLNVENTAQFMPMIREIQKRNTAIIPAIGGDLGGGLINNQTYKRIAKGYRNFTDYIRIEAMQLYYETNGGPAAINEMLDYLINTLRFNHIMLNPWPKPSPGEVVHYKQPQIDASFAQVSLNFTHAEPYTIHPDPMNWYPNPSSVTPLRSYNKGVSIVLNYENAPQELALNRTEMLHHDSKGDMNITFTSTQQQGLGFAPPFSQNYDPIAFGTWLYIANRLSDLQ